MICSDSMFPAGINVDWERHRPQHAAGFSQRSHGALGTAKAWGSLHYDPTIGKNLRMALAENRARLKAGVKQFITSLINAN